MDDNLIISENISTARRSLGINQTSLALEMIAAGQAQWRQTTVSRIEGGHQPVSTPELSSLLQILGVSVLNGTALLGMMKLVHSQTPTCARCETIAPLFRV